MLALKLATLRSNVTRYCNQMDTLVASSPVVIIDISKLVDEMKLLR